MKRLIIFSLLLALAVAPANAQWFKKGLFKKKETADTVPGMKRLTEVMTLLQKQYVIDPNTDKLSEDAIRHMFKSLDPHSMYIAAKDVRRQNEALQGNFEGVGITFSIINDTICVQEVLAGGPSEKVGILPGDKILRVDSVSATGDSASNAFVFRHLRGKKGTVVVVDALRGKENITFHIVRDKIPIHSIEVYFMEDDSIGYINLMRFARNSVSEFRKAVDELRDQGMQSLILDLRGNSGGFLDIACGLSNEFLSPRRLIVYQEGRNRPRQEFRTNLFGSFRKGDLVVLIDESSASASEIVSGAVQDWDRGLIIGRRSFGKGLVQTMFTLSDGAQVRITTARYYTPSGRCIQRPYDKGTDDYNQEFVKRYNHGEMFSADSIQLPDSLKYTTHGGRTVYGGGGIMPDIFVPMDTTPATPFYRECRRKGIINQFSNFWADQHRGDTLLADFDRFRANYDSLPVDSAFIAYAATKGVSLDSLLLADSTDLQSYSFDTAEHFLLLQIKGMIADALYGRGHYYRFMKEEDPVYRAAVDALRRRQPLLQR